MCGGALAAEPTIMHAVFVTRFAPQPVGHGGHHRSYQIFPELQAALGPGAVQLYTPVAAAAPATAAPSVAPRRRAAAGGRLRLDLFRQFLRVGGHPYKLLAYLLSTTFALRQRFWCVAAAPYRAFLPAAAAHGLCGRPSLLC
jgi:hypothetical protein